MSIGYLPDRKSVEFLCMKDIELDFRISKSKSNTLEITDSILR